VVNIMSEWFVEAANHCCGNFDYGEDEMALSGLTPLPSVKVPWEAAAAVCAVNQTTSQEGTSIGLAPHAAVQVRPPRVKESAVHMECELRHTYDVKDASGRVTATIVIGEVVLMHVHEGVAGAFATGKGTWVLSCLVGWALKLCGWG
jgi:flavin reductase (DIM6/NTAB) family NADH-FMN oxidoreductase RutF